MICWKVNMAWSGAAQAARKVSRGKGRAPVRKDARCQQKILRATPMHWPGSPEGWPGQCGGAELQGGAFNSAYAPSQRRSTKLALVPPKPKLFDSAVRIGASTVSRTSGMPSAAGSSVSMLAEPAMKPCCSISRQ